MILRVHICKTHHGFNNVVGGGRYLIMFHMYVFFLLLTDSAYVY